MQVSCFVHICCRKVIGQNFAISFECFPACPQEKRHSNDKICNSQGVFLQQIHANTTPFINVYATQKSRQGMSLFKYLGTYISVEHVRRVFYDN